MNDNTKPLAGKRIVVTRAPEQSAEFIAQLAALGAEVLALPSLAFAEPQDVGPLDDAIRQLDHFDWLVLTSVNVVRFLGRRIAHLELPAEVLNRLLLTPEVAVIGPATHNEALSLGFRPNFEASEARAEILIRELGPRLVRKRVLLPRSDIADPNLPVALRAEGAEVVEVVAYRTVAPELFDPRVTEALCAGEIDVVTLFSPSAFHNLVVEVGLVALRNRSEKTVLAAIGPVTANAVRNAGLTVPIVGREATAASLAEAIGAYFAQRTNLGANR